MESVARGDGVDMVTTVSGSLWMPAVSSRGQWAVEERERWAVVRVSSEQ